MPYARVGVAQLKIVAAQSSTIGAKLIETSFSPKFAMKGAEETFA